jgi:deoxyhypusine synthase
MRNGDLENLWISENHDTKQGKKWIIDILTDVNELSNILFEDTSKKSMHFQGWVIH